MTMCVSYVYKRRKLRNSVAVLPEKVAKNLYSICGSYISSVESYCHSTVTENDEVSRLEISPFDSADEVSSTKSPVANGKGPISMLPVSQIPAVFSGKQVNDDRKMDSVFNSDDIPVGDVGSVQKDSEVTDFILMSEHDSSASDVYSSPNSHMELFALSNRSEAENLEDCSSFDVSAKVVMEPPLDSSATSETSINDDQLVRDGCPSNIDLPPNCLDRYTRRYCLECQICNIMGISNDMLICDLCEKACHLHCCSENIPLREDWYCQHCSGKSPRTLLVVSSGIIFSASGHSRRAVSRLELGPILSMLRDTEPYVSKARIGKNFQAEVPEWPAISSQNEDPFGEPSNLDMEDLSVLRVGNINSCILNSVGNWVQCRDKHEYGGICGKWRRAPVFVHQTDDWDCSCAVLWDPYHADCSVPQELKSEEILKQLKYIEMLRSRFPKRHMDKPQAHSRYE